MDYWRMEKTIGNLYEQVNEARSKNNDLKMDIELLEEEISYLRPMVRYLVEHLSTKVTLDELCTIEKIKEDLSYFEERDCDIEDGCVYK